MSTAAFMQGKSLQRESLREENRVIEKKVRER